MPNIKFIPHLSANNHLLIHTILVCRTISLVSLKRTESQETGCNKASGCHSVFKVLGVALI